MVWNITSRCNLNCQHCYFLAQQTKNRQELSYKEAERFIADLSLLKVPVLLFSGGEPLLREDIFELAKFARGKRIRTALSTNGTLITQETAKRIKETGFSYVGISLDGEEKTNDWFRNKSGAFTLALAGIRNCKSIGLKVGLRFTLTKYNFKDLSNMFGLAERENVERFCIYHLVYTGRGSNLKENDLSHEETKQVLEFIWQKTLDFKQRNLKTEVLTVDNHADGVWIYLRLKRVNPQHACRVLELLKGQGGNNSGIKVICVDDCGRVFPDQFWRTYLLGDLRQRKFSDIWQDKDNGLMEALRNRKPLLKGRCQKCNYLKLCNGNFRARAEAVSGDSWAQDPACYLAEEEINNKWD